MFIIIIFTTLIASSVANINATSTTTPNKTESTNLKELNSNLRHNNTVVNGSVYIPPINYCKEKTALLNKINSCGYKEYCCINSYETEINLQCLQKSNNTKLCNILQKCKDNCKSKLALLNSCYNNCFNNAYTCSLIIPLYKLNSKYVNDSNQNVPELALVFLILLCLCISRYAFCNNNYSIMTYKNKIHTNTIISQSSYV
jgi:hypothetical protein